MMEPVPVWGGPGPHGWLFFTVSSQGWGGRGAFSLALPVHGAPSSRPHLLPERPPPPVNLINSTLTLGVKIQHRNFEDVTNRPESWGPAF